MIAPDKEYSSEVCRSSFDFLPKLVDFIFPFGHNIGKNTYGGGTIMDGYMSTKEAALCWNITERRVSDLCKEGRIAGVQKNGRFWLIPLSASKPADNRVISGAYRKDKRPANLPLPIGISDYRRASTEYYYIDKTLMIRDFIDECPMVSLFTRPRRFGKTLNMDMLRTFFEKSDEDTSVYFKDKLIWSCGKKYREYQGKYPVIFVSFKDVKANTWEDTLEIISGILSSEFSRHEELPNSWICVDSDKAFYSKIVNGTASVNELGNAFRILSKMLHEHHGVAPIIIIDEYDTPIQQGHMQGFYDDVILFMRNLFSGGLKDNKHLSYGFLTGILRVAKESIFSGLNNLAVNSILDKKYSQYFGFTAEEVRQMAAYYQAEDKFEEICQWYDGYRFGNTDIFNPWSVINYFRNDCQARAYWQSTGSNDIIGEILNEADESVYEKLHAILQGESFLTYIDTGVIYPQIRNNPSSVYSFLLVAGYLKVLRSDTAFSSDYMCEVALPNKEIAFVYNKEILQKLSPILPPSTAISIQEAIYTNNLKMLNEKLRTLLLQSASSFDTVGENFYHGLLLGLCAVMDNRYIITSNRESGEGRYDLALCPRDNTLPGILIELKYGKNCDTDQLKQLASSALAQIRDRMYDTEMTARGVTTVYKYGVAFCGKQVEIAAK